MAFMSITWHFPISLSVFPSTPPRWLPSSSGPADTSPSETPSHATPAPVSFCSISLVAPGQPHLWLLFLTWSPWSSAQSLSTFLMLLDDPRSSHDFKYLHSYIPVRMESWRFQSWTEAPLIMNYELLINSPWMSYSILNSRGFFFFFFKGILDSTSDAACYLRLPHLG